MTAFYQILQGYDNIQLIVPEDGTSFEVGATAIFNGCAHPNAAKLWIEYALSPDCVDHAKENGSYQFLVLSNATQPEEATKFGLDMNNTIDYDFEDAKGKQCQVCRGLLRSSWKLLRQRGLQPFLDRIGRASAGVRHLET